MKRNRTKFIAVEGGWIKILKRVPEWTSTPGYEIEFKVRHAEGILRMRLSLSGRSKPHLVTHGPYRKYLDGLCLMDTSGAHKSNDQEAR